MKCRIHRFLSLFMIMLLIVISFTKELPVQQAQASVKSEELAHTYLNVLCKYLYLNKPGKNKFDFNINKSALQQGASYSWYIKADKGNPKAVSINSKTGVVTAKRVGTAYIRCKITLANKMVLRPEAKVIVINNIVGIEINNIPENATITAGTSMDFNQSILNTVAGKDVTASGITRWEIANDTAGVGNASEEGVINPKKSGKFDIRAVCFQSIKEYNLWLVNKGANTDCITAASDWVTITVVATVGEASTQEQLNELLLAENITQITLSTETEQKIKIMEGDFSDRTLIVNVPNAGITNYGTFKLITIKSASNSTWEENADNNNLVIYDSDISLLISKEAQVNSVEFGKSSGTSNAELSRQNLNINKESQIQNFASNTDIKPVNFSKVLVTGKIKDLSITAASKIILSGGGSVDQVTIEETSKGTKLATSVAIDLVSYADLITTFMSGSEGSTISILANATATIENISIWSIRVTNSSGFITLSSNQAIIMPSKGAYTLIGTVYTSSIMNLTPSVVTSVTGSAIHMGQRLWDSTLSGTFICNTFKVEGTLSWLIPDTVVNTTGYYAWSFTPADTSHYNTVIGAAKVSVIEEITPVLKE